MYQAPLTLPSIPTIARIVAVLACLIMGGEPAWAQSSDSKALADRLERLERDLLTLQRQVYRGQASTPSGGPPLPAPSASAVPMSADAVGRFESRVSGLEDQMRDMTGRLEETQFSINQLRERLDKLVSDVDFRLGALEQGKGGQAPGNQPGPAPAAAGAPPLAGGPLTPGQAQRAASPPNIPGQSPTAPAAGNLGSMTQGQLSANLPSTPGASSPSAQGGRPAAPAASILPDGPASEQFKFAFNIMAQNDYEQAERAFKAFLAAHPNEPESVGAQFWLANIYYVRKRYDEAAQAFAETYQKYPKATRAPEALLKLGASLSRLNRAREACVTFARFDEQFPDAPANLKAQLANERKTANCR
ncbi:MAG: tol-pal system protein YbgF [Proteobacteria bacterium]|nr:tol-pal system protein YbgF [Pseudomonadota bacterium]MBI3496509.1 tol-pal system protein YbgF [Pseudomonadota bacterium]